MNIEQIVKKLVKKYKTNNPFELAYLLNIKVIISPLFKIKGFYQYCARNKFIHINDDITGIDQKILCAHELGHAILHSKLNIVFLEKYTLFSKNRYENEANLFCTYLLFTDSLCKEYHDYTYEQISSATGIPVDYIKLLKK